MEHLSELVKIIAVVIYDERHTNLELNSEFKLSEVFIHFPPTNSVSPRLPMRFYHNISSILWHSVL